MPVFFDLDGSPRTFYIGWYIRDAQRHPEVPRLTPEQVEAMELLESIANDPSFSLEMDFQPGDVQLLNNARILHAREAYEDDPDPARRRHLLRLWLAAHHFASTDDLLRSGIPRQT
jgi:alpha-ketoglutarate-dependent taurine dioxygenase